MFLNTVDIFVIASGWSDFSNFWYRFMDQTASTCLALLAHWVEYRHVSGDRDRSVEI